MLEAEAPTAMPAAPSVPPVSNVADRIEVEAGGVVVRLPVDVAPDRLAAVAAALRSAP